MISLRVILSAIKDNSYSQFRGGESKGWVFISTVPTTDQGLVDYEVIKTFISIMRNVNDYLDQMIAVVNLAKKEFRAPHPMTSKEATEYMNSLLDMELNEYSRQRREEMKEKLKHFGDLPQEFIKYMTTYATLRNCYEHHKAISGRGLQIPIKQMGLYTQGNKELSLGDTVEGGSTISLKFIQKTISIKKGQAAHLSYEDLVSTEFYLGWMVPSQIENRVIEIIKKANSPV